MKTAGYVDGARVRDRTTKIGGTFRGHALGHPGYCGVDWDNELGRQSTITRTVSLDRIELEPVRVSVHAVQLAIAVKPETRELPARYTITTPDGVAIAEDAPYAGALDVVGAYLFELADTARGVVGNDL